MPKKIKVINLDSPEVTPESEEDDVQIIEDDKSKPLLAIADIEEEPDNKKVKTLVQVQCPKCNKSMTENTLKYYHKNRCMSNPDVQPKTRGRRSKSVMQNNDKNEEPLTPEKVPPPPKLERQVNRYQSNQRIQRLVSFAF